MITTGFDSGENGIESDSDGEKDKLLKNDVFTNRFDKLLTDIDKILDPKLVKK